MNELYLSFPLWLADTRFGKVYSKKRDVVSHAQAHTERASGCETRGSLCIVAPSLVLLSRSSHVCMVGLFKTLEALFRGFLHSLEHLS